MWPENSIKKLLETPEVWFAINAQIDGVDPLDISPNGRVKYLCYIKRQQLHFLESAAMLSASASEGKDVSKAVEKLRSIILPSDPDQIIRETARKQAIIAKDQTKVFRKDIVNGREVLRMFDKCQ